MNKDLTVDDVINFLGNDTETIADYLLWALDNPNDARNEITKYNEGS